MLCSEESEEESEKEKEIVFLRAGAVKKLRLPSFLR